MELLIDDKRAKAHRRVLTAADRHATGVDAQQGCRRFFAVRVHQYGYFRVGGKLHQRFGRKVRIVYFDDRCVLVHVVGVFGVAELFFRSEGVFGRQAFPRGGKVFLMLCFLLRQRAAQGPLSEGREAGRGRQREPRTGRSLARG